MGITDSNLPESFDSKTRTRKKRVNRVPPERSSPSPRAWRWRQRGLPGKFENYSSPECSSHT